MKLRGNGCIQRSAGKNEQRKKEETSCAKHAGAAGRNRVAANRNERGERESSLRFFFKMVRAIPAGTDGKPATGSKPRMGNPDGVSGI